MNKIIISVLLIAFVFVGCKRQTVPDNTLVVYPKSGKKYIAYKNSTVEQFCKACNPTIIGVEFYRRNKIMLSRMCR